MVEMRMRIVFDTHAGETRVLVTSTSPLLVSSLFLHLSFLLFRFRFQTMTIPSLKGVVGCRLGNKPYATITFPYINTWNLFLFFLNYNNQTRPSLQSQKMYIYCKNAPGGGWFFFLFSLRVIGCKGNVWNQQKRPLNWIHMLMYQWEFDA